MSDIDMMESLQIGYEHERIMQLLVVADLRRDRRIADAYGDRGIYHLSGERRVRILIASLRDGVADDGHTCLLDVRLHLDRIGHGLLQALDALQADRGPYELVVEGAHLDPRLEQRSLPVPADESLRRGALPVGHDGTMPGPYVIVGLVGAQEYIRSLRMALGGMRFFSFPSLMSTVLNATWIRWAIVLTDGTLSK